MNIKYFTFWGLLLLFASCTEEVVNTLTYPTTFTFNTPVLESRSLHLIDTFYTGTGTNKVLNWKFTAINENLGTFDRSNSVISDTLNQMIRDTFADINNKVNFPLRIENGSMITSITLISADKMKISYGRLDTVGNQNNPLLDRIVNTKDTTFSYKPEGNFIIPGLYLNNDSRELYLSNEFVYAGIRGTSPRKYEYLRSLSNGPDVDRSLKRLVGRFGPLKYDTASVEYVNFIFSSYK
jgi:hypothetical protein